MKTGWVGFVVTILSLISFRALASGPAICDIKSYGAIGDGKTVNTVAIQKAVDDCSRLAGVVAIHDGVYLTGMIHITGSIELSVQPNATLKGTQNIDDFPDIFPQTHNTQLGSCRKALIYVDTADHVLIDGGGTIDGNGINPNWTGKEWTRPMTIFAALSRNVTIQNVNVKDAAMWAVVMFETDNAQIRGINLNSTYGKNRDGIDIVDSHQVLIENNNIATEDDSICLKTGSPRGVQEVVVRKNHVLKSEKANGLKMGTASTGFFKNILFEDNLIENIRKAAMAVESVDGGDIENIKFNRIQFKAGSAVFLILGIRDNAPKVGSIQNVSFTNISGTTTESWGSAITGSIIKGKTYSPQNISFSNVSIQSSSGAFFTPNEPPEYAGQYPDPDLWKNLPAYGFYLRHIQNYQMQNVSFKASTFERRKDIITIP